VLSLDRSLPLSLSLSLPLSPSLIPEPQTLTPKPSAQLITWKAGRHYETQAFTIMVTRPDRAVVSRRAHI